MVEVGKMTDKQNTSSKNAPTKSRHGKFQKDDESNQADRVLAHCKSQAFEFWQDHTQEAYVSVPTRGNYRNFRVDSKAFKDVLFDSFYSVEKEGITTRTHDAVIPTLRGQARAGEVHEVFMRVAGDGKTWIEIDLGDNELRSIHIDIAQETYCLGPHRARFIRSKTMLPLPVPTRGGKLSELRAFMPNVDSDADFLGIIGFLISAMNPARNSVMKTPSYPILALNGEHGSGKTKLLRYIRALCDPSEIEERPMFRDSKDIVPATRSSHIIALDNLSKKIPSEISDILCCIATGTTMAGRELYTTGEEFSHRAHRPIILSGITDDFLAQNDLRDRCYSIQLAMLPPEKKRTESSLDSAWAEAYPRIFGALLDVIDMSLKRRAAVAAQIEGREDIRMLDAAAMLVAAEECLEFPPGTALAALRKQRADAYAATLGDDLSMALSTFVSGKGLYQGKTWEGTLQEFRDALTEIATSGGKRSAPKGWPINTKSLMQCIEQRRGALRSTGLVIDRRRTNSTKYVKLSLIAAEAAILAA
jgi:hypothetical protein